MLRPSLARAVRPLGSLVGQSSRPRPHNSLRNALRTQPARCRATWTQQIHGARENARIVFRAHPFQFSLAMFCIACGAGGVIYGTYTYYFHIMPIDQRFPPPVANKLKRALYYSNADPQPNKAVEYYKQALALADECGMHPFSDEYLGIKFTIAAFLEKVHHYDNAIQILEQTRNDCFKFIELYGGREENRALTPRLKKKIVQISNKLGALYSLEWVNDLEAAEQNLTQAVEMALREQERREKEGVIEGEGDWLSKEELGGALESLAHHYEAKSMHNLAAPLFLRAITLSPPPCHATVLMNNLSISLAQTSPETSIGAPTSRPALIANARSWAEKALAVAQGVQPPERTEECDMGCAVATHNLGEFAEMEGLIDEARKKYTEAASLSKAIGFMEGQSNANEGLKRLNKNR